MVCLELWRLAVFVAIDVGSLTSRRAEDMVRRVGIGGRAAVRMGWRVSFARNCLRRRRYCRKYLVVHETLLLPWLRA